MPTFDRDQLCACGCGQPLLPARGSARYYQARFRKGHRLKPCRPRYSPSVAETPTGICECGCGQRTPIATHTFRRLRHFIGQPLPFVPGHGDRSMKKRPACGPDNPTFIGARMRNGYRYIYVPAHPCALNGNWAGYVAEHRVVAELALGRPIGAREHVHHINGIRHDNRPENLIALTNAEHTKLHRSQGHHCSDETRRKISASLRRAWEEGRRHR